MTPAELSGLKFGAGAIPLPLWALLPLTLVSVFPLIFAWRAVRSGPGRFLIVAVWLRIAFDGWAYITLQSYGGVKPITILSLATIAVGLLVVDRRLWAMKAMLPFYALIALMMLSAGLNHSSASFLDPAVRLIYLAILMLAGYGAMRIEGVARLSAWLLTAFGPAFLLQAGSVVLGVKRLTERDNSAAYVGGFGHESAFALLVIAFLIAVRFATRLGLWSRFALLAFSSVSLLLANYRTAIIAVAPLIAWQATELLLGGLPRRQRGAALAMIAVLGMGTLGVAMTGAESRYADLWTMVQNPASLVRDPSDFTRAEKATGSGRSYLWSSYYAGWHDSPALQRGVGNGPNSSNDVFKVYAQNTLLSFLYELGVLGVMSMLILWMTMIGFAATAPWPERGYLLVAQVTFVLLNMSTMPFDMIDGLVLVAMLYGYTLYFHYARGNRQVVSGHAAPSGLRALAA